MAQGDKVKLMKQEKYDADADARVDIAEGIDTVTELIENPTEGQIATKGGKVFIAILE